MGGPTNRQYGKTILYVEDDDETRRCVGDRLRRRGFVVRDVATGQAAVDVVSDGVRPDAVLLDLVLPDMDGLQAHTRILEQHPAVPTVICSGALSRIPAGTLQRAIGKHGRLLAKPCEFRVLLEAIENVVADDGIA